MATTASITIEVDDQGALTALQNINSEAGKLGPRLTPIGAQSVEAFGKMTGATFQAREGTRLLSEELGIRLPRALSTVIGESNLVGPAINAAFGGIALVGFIGLAVQAGEGIAKLVDKLEGWTAGAKATMDLQVALNNSIIQHIAKMKLLDEEYQLIGLTGLPLLAKQQDLANQKMVEAKKAADDATAAYAKLLAQSREMGGYTEKQRQAENAQLPPGARYTGPLPPLTLTPAALAVNPQLLAELDAAKTKAKETLDEMQKDVAKAGKNMVGGIAADAISALDQMNQAALAGLEGFQKIAVSESQQIKAVEAAELAGTTSVSLGEAKKVNIKAQSVAQQIALQQQLTERTRALQNQATLAGMGSLEQIAEKERQAVENEHILLDRGLSSREQFDERVVALQKQRADEVIKFYKSEADAEIKANESANDAIVRGWTERDKKEQQHAEKMRRMQDETLNAERQAAIATAPPWERANAQIVADYQYRMDRIKEQIKTGDLYSEHAAAQAAAAWDIRFAETRDQIASTMQSLFDDITSGNIGQRFLKLFEQMVFRMVATWLTGLQAMHAATSGALGGGGIFGTILSFLGLGGKSGAAGSAGTVGVDGGGTGIPGLGGGGGGVTAAAALGGNAVANAAGLNFGSSAGSFAGVANGPNVSTSGLLTGLGLSAGLGGSVPGAVLPAGAGILSKLGGSAALLPLLGMGGLELIGLAGKAGPLGGAALGTAGGAAVGAALLGLSGTGILSGIAPLTIFSLAGALTFGIATAIGGILGLLFGLFGSKKRQKAITNLEGQLEGQIKQVVDSYNNYQTDYSSAFQSLESLRSQYHDAMHKLGGDTNTRVEAHVNVAE